MTPQGHDDLTWTWTAPGGEVFKGSADYIDGCRAGWEARAWTVPAAPTADELAAVPWEPEKAFVRPNAQVATAIQLLTELDDASSRLRRAYEKGVKDTEARRRCKFSATCEHAHPDDIATHTDGGTW